MRILPILKKLRRDEKGISAVEYAILIGVVGVGLVVTLGTAGTGISDYVSDQINALTEKTGNSD